MSGSSGIVQGVINHKDTKSTENPSYSFFVDFVSLWFGLLIIQPRHRDAAFLRASHRLLVSRIDMPDHAHAWVAVQDEPESPLGVGAAVADDDHAGVEAVADADAAAMVDADPAGAARRVDQ